MDFNALVAECAPWVAPKTMAAIVRTESQFKPLAININGGARLERQPATKDEAAVTAKWLIANNYNIDMGLGQVNSVNLSKTNLSIEDAFDPCKNLAAAATILKWNYDSASKRVPGQQAALGAAISAYNTGSFTKGFSNGYVQKVVNNSRSVAPTEVAQKSVIMPIPLVSTPKRPAVKTASTVMADVPALKIKTAKAEAVEASPNSVYSEAKQEQSIMVYR
ncbi:MAG: lytic transglycosylase domain-containing protein [Methylotenera sp.]